MLTLTLWQIVILACIQGAAELLPVSSSAHVIMAQKLMGLDPTHPQMTFLLVMLHTGTMIAVLFYFRNRWLKTLRSSGAEWIKQLVWATGITGVLGLTLKKIIEHLLSNGHTQGEIEQLFGYLPLMAFFLVVVGIFIFWSGKKNSKPSVALSLKSAAWIGVVQGLCLPFRGFSRSGATISMALAQGVSRPLAEDFSFALAVILTPPVIALEWHRLYKHIPDSADRVALLQSSITPGIIGLLCSFVAGLFALRFLSRWLENGKWQYFGIYCWFAAVGALVVHVLTHANPI